jgi:phytoene/squalene synthetase
LFRGESPDPLLPWAPAFAGEAVLSEVLHRRVNRVNDSEDKGTLSDWRSEIALLHAERPRHALTRALGKAIHLYGLPCCDFLAVIDGMEMDARTDIRAPAIVPK